MEAEVAVLGSILLENDVLDSEALSELTPAMFYREGHRCIFAAMLALRAEREPVDLVMLNVRLTAAGQLDNVGGLPYLIGLGEQTPTSAYAEHYARIVREKWQLREVIRASGQAMSAAFDQQMPLEDIVGQLGAIGADLDPQAHRGAYSVADVVAEVLRDVQGGTGEPPLSTGFTDLDDQLSGGLYPGTLNVLAARPSMGKSACALNIAENVAAELDASGTQGQVVVVSLEMRRQQLVVRLLSSAASIHAGAVQAAMQGKPAMTEGQHRRFEQAAQRLGALPMQFLDDATDDASLRTLPAKLRRAHRESPLKLVVIDYLQLMEVSGKGAENRVQEVSTISRKLKQLAREYGCPFLVLSQLSRAVEQRPNKRPLLSDLRDSGAVEQDADTVLFIYRDEYYNAQTDQQGVAEIIVAKQREGAVGTVKLQFQGNYVRFANLARYA
ncbi:replicative DNA helicase [Deinococcus lacus]|uniref:Replicative DNA helicase n=1 Tax=Deinococcus lacus TaxID=392561 RepID=A0ABW1YBS0_9DEIO